MNNRLAIYILSVVAIALGVVSCGRTGISKSVVMADSLSQSDPAGSYGIYRHYYRTQRKYVNGQQNALRTIEDKSSEQRRSDVYVRQRDAQYR